MPNLVARPFDIEFWGSPTNIYNSINETETLNGWRNTMNVGAVIGTPGTLPTNWFVNSLSGLSQQVVSFGYENGLPYIDVRVFGVAAGTQVRISPDLTFGVINARAGETWTHSFTMRMVAGAITNTSGMRSFLIGRTPGNGVTDQFQSATITPTGVDQLLQATGTFVDTTTAYVGGDFRLDVVNTGAVDITIRIKAIQIEKGGYATAFIPTSNGIVYRTAQRAPDGTPMDRIIEDTNTGNHAASVTGLAASGTRVSGFVYIKPAGRTKVRLGANATSGVSFDLNAGTILTPTGAAPATARIRGVGNGIFLVELIKFNTGGAQGLFFSLLDNAGSDNYTGDGQSGVYLWGVGLFVGDDVQYPYGGTGSAGFTGGWLLAERGHVAPPPPPKPRVRKPSAAELAAKERERQIAARQKELSLAEAARIARAQKLWGNDSPEPDTIRLPNAMPRDRGPKIVKLPKRR